MALLATTTWSGRFASDNRAHKYEKLHKTSAIELILSLMKTEFIIITWLLLYG